MTSAMNQVFWDDIIEGQELPGTEFELTPTRIVLQVSGSQDFYPVHHDQSFARDGGHEDTFINTGYTRALLTKQLTDLAGADGWVKSFTFAMRKMNQPGDKVRVKGKIVRRYESDGEEGLVDVDLWMENDRVGVTTPASGTVMLPRR